MPKTLRIFLPLGLLVATFFAFSSARAAVFVNVSTGACLDDKGAVTTNANPLQAFSCNATFAQQWNWEGGPIQGIGGKCVDVQGGGTADRTPVQLYACNGTAAQQWQYINGSLFNPHSGKCIDANGGAPNQAVIYTCSNSPLQRWNIRS